jgi:CRP-like cAMP-binding protein
VTEAETSLERELSTLLMRGGVSPKIRRVRQGETLVEQGDPGHEVFLLLDGILSVEVNGETLAEIGPGAILGERAHLEGGTRKATLRAVTECKVAAGPPERFPREALEEVASGHRREEA